MNQQIPFGEEELQAGWRVSPTVDLEAMIFLSYRIINYIEMKVEGEPHISHYPNENGNGGTGIQLYQPLVESWIIISSWPELGFMRINLSSCKPFNPVSVKNYLQYLGYKILKQLLPQKL